METRQLGSSDLHLTVLGLGTWAMGGSGWRAAWGPQDDAQSIATIRHALDLGINWLDTAPIYGFGHSEAVVGRALKGLARLPIVATKCGRIPAADGFNIADDLRKASVKAECEVSLKRLGLERIDLYQIHWNHPEEQLEEAWEAIAELRAEGKVRHGGVSNFTVAQMRRLQARAPLASLQPPYSLLRRDIEPEILPWCQAHGVGVVVYSPLEKGLLTGKVTREWVAALPADDHRRQDGRFLEPLLSANQAVVAELSAVAAATGHTPAHAALSWCLRRPEVTSTIVGARSPRQVDELVAAAAYRLTNDELARLQRALDTRATRLAT